MRIIDLHCYPGTPEWIQAQGPYVEALAKYWKRSWVGKSEDDVVAEFTEAKVQACLVALDLETTVATPPCTNEYVHAMWKRHPERIIQCWGAVEPAKGEIALRQVRKAVKELGFIGFHFHPIMQHFAVNDRRYYPLFE
ncbi:MAG TPA: amidohydrolase family protein, partial [Ramlibacter sp.]|nr:amidohydrolase family protein [Ramlibacter sp.]